MHRLVRRHPACPGEIGRSRDQQIRELAEFHMLEAAIEDF